MCAQFDLNGEVAEIIGVPGEDKLAARPLEAASVGTFFKGDKD